MRNVHCSLKIVSYSITTFRARTKLNPLQIFCTLFECDVLDKLWQLFFICREIWCFQISGSQRSVFILLLWMVIITSVVFCIRKTTELTSSSLVLVCPGLCTVMMGEVTHPPIDTRVLLECVSWPVLYITNIIFE